MSPRARSAATRSKAAPVSNCSSACLTRDHASWGECVRSKGLQLSPAVNDNYSSRQTKLDRDLDHYESAVRQGLEPSGTSRSAVDQAFKEAELNA